VHIGMILGVNRRFPPDIRVEKEMRALAEAGYHVTVLTKQIPEGSARREEIIPERAYVKRVQVPNSGRGPFSRFKTAVSLIEQSWKKHLEALVREDKVDVFHVHDFKMVPTVLQAAKGLNILVVADLHENMPAVLVARRSELPKLKKMKDAILRNYYLWRWHESKRLKECAKIIVVVPEAAERLYRYGIKREKIVIVSNTEDKDTFRFASNDADPAIVEKYKEFWTISYVGGIGPHRGLDTLLKAVPAALQEIPKLKLVIVGARERDSAFLSSEINSGGVRDSVDIIGWQPFEKVYSYMIASRVCVIPYNDFEHTQTTVPHKLFQAMICARPVLVSNVRPLKRIVEEAKAGCVFRANDSRDLAQKLMEMFNHPGWLSEMGLNGQHAALGKYAWGNDAKRLLEMYRELNEFYVR
jgi:glycosyltransferase involved in cell wall biosynthesis